MRILTLLVRILNAWEILFDAPATFIRARTTLIGAHTTLLYACAILFEKHATLINERTTLIGAHAPLLFAWATLFNVPVRCLLKRQRLAWWNGIDYPALLLIF